jgi:hypothetical protein
LLLVSLPRLLSGQQGDKAANTPKYTVASQISFSKKLNKIDGKLQILEDSRLTPERREKLWGSGGINIDDDPTLSTFRSEPPHNAQLRILDAKGNVSEILPLEQPLAKLSSTMLYGTLQPTYLVTVDYSAGFGSYSGPITLLGEVHDGSLHWLEAVNRATGEKSQIRLMASLKTTWKIVQSSSRARKEILLAACRPNSF